MKVATNTNPTTIPSLLTTTIIVLRCWVEKLKARHYGASTTQQMVGRRNSSSALCIRNKKKHLFVSYSPCVSSTNISACQSPLLSTTPTTTTTTATTTTTTATGSSSSSGRCDMCGAVGTEEGGVHLGAVVQELFLEED